MIEIIPDVHDFGAEAPIQPEAEPNDYMILPFSAESQVSLEDLMKRWNEFAAENEFLISDAAFTLQHDHKSFDYRTAVVVKSREGLINELDQLEVRSPTSSIAHREPVFMFSGQGSQYRGMAMESYETDPVFRAALLECDSILKEVSGIDLVDLIFEGDPDRINETQLAQPALFSVGFAQAKRWMDWGFSPSALMGHDIGEYVAATLSGVMSLRDAIWLVVTRGRLMQQKEPMLEEFEQVVSKTTLRPPSIPYLSNVTGTWISDQQATSPDYYVTQIRSAANFRQGIEKIAAGGEKLFIEMGPGQALTTLVNDTLEGTDHLAISSLPGPGDDIDSRLFTRKALADTWIGGQILDWSGIFPTAGRQRISLPIRCLDETTCQIKPNIKMANSIVETKSIFHTPIWRESKSGFAGVPITPGDKTVWLCFTNPLSPADKGIVEATGGLASRRVLVRPGKGFKRLSPTGYRINPSLEEDYDLLIQSVLNDFGTIGGVIHTWSCARPFVRNDEKVWKNQAARALSALWLGKALGGIGNRSPIPLNFITKGLIRGKGGKLYPGNAALAAAAGVIQREYPNLVTRTIDLGERDFDIRTEETFAKVLNGDRHHLKLAMKDGSWWLPTFEKDDPELIDPLNPLREIKNGGTYLITGGLGGLARTIAKDFSSRRENLTFVLVTRSPFPSRSEWETLIGDDSTDRQTKTRIEDLMGIEQNGSRVQIVTADLSEPGVMEGTLNAVQRQHEAIDGVIHAAGVLHEGPIATKQIRGIEQVFSAKAVAAQGIFNYFESPNHNTDFVVFFSSVSTELATIGQSDYAAANAYLDGLAEEAYALGLPFFCVSWPAWREVGMAAETDTSAAGETGLSEELMKHSISPDQGADAFFDVISYSDSPRKVVSVLDFDDHYQSLLEERQPKDHRGEESISRVEAPVEQMISIWKKELKTDAISEDDDYFELGGDSLFAVRLLSRIQETFGQSIPMSLLIKAPTPRLLVQAMGLDADVEVVLHEGLPDHILPLRIEEDSDATPMFCIHGADGSVMFYQGFANQLEKGRSVYGVESRYFHDESYVLEDSIEEMAERYLCDIKEVEPEGPYLFAGYSFGALVALRMAQLAEERGDEVEGVIIYDMFNPEYIRRYPIHERLKVIWDRRSIFPFGPRVRSSLARCGELIKWAGLHAIDWYRFKSGRIRGEHARHIESRYMNESLIPRFQPNPYEGRVLLVVTEDPGDKFDYGDLHGWRKTFTGRLMHRFVTGNHLEMFSGRHLELLVNHTDYFLEGAPQRKYEPVSKSEEVSIFREDRYGKAGRIAPELVE